MEGRDLGVGLWRNAQRLIGKTDANLSDREIEERIQNDAAARQFENAADQGDIERDSWLTGQGTMDADQLRQAGQPVRSGVIDSMSFMGNPATVLSHGAGELLGPTISRTVTAPVLRGTGKALMAVGEAAGKSSGALPAIGRMVAEAGTEAVPGAVPRAGQSLLEKGGKSMARQTMSGTANALPSMAAAQSPQEAAAALGGGLGSVPMGTLHEVFGARPSAPTVRPESASAAPAESPGIPRTNVPPSAEGGAASGFSSADATPPASPSAEPDPAVGGTWGGLTREQVGQTVETRDGRSGVLKDVGNRKVALRDATGQAHAVPRGDVRLAQPTPPTPPVAEDSRPTPISNRSESVSAAASAGAPADPARTTGPGQNPSEPAPSSDTDSGRAASPAPLPGQPGAPIRPGPSDRSSSEVSPSSYSHDRLADMAPSESDPRTDTYKGNTLEKESGWANAGDDARSGFTGDSNGVGSSGLPPIKPMSVNDQDTLRTAIADKRSEMEKRYAELGIVPTDDPNGDFAVTPDWNGKITPNLPEDRLFNHAVNKSRGDIDAALEVVNNAHEEEYYHTIDQLQMKRDWISSAGPSPPMPISRIM